MHSFLVVFLCFIFSFLFFIMFICIPRVPAFLGSPGGGFYAWVTRDVTSDLVLFGVPLLARPGLCLLHAL